MSIEFYGLGGEDIRTIENIARDIRSWLTDIYWVFNLNVDQGEIQAMIIDIFGDKKLDSRIRFKESSQIYKGKRGIDSNDFQIFCKSLLEKIVSTEKDNEEIRTLCDGFVFLNRLSRRSPLAKISDYKKLFEIYGEKLKLPAIASLKELNPRELNSLATKLMDIVNSRFLGGEDIRIDGLSILSEFIYLQSGFFVPLFTPIDTYLTHTGKRFREELKKYST